MNRRRNLLLLFIPLSCLVLLTIAVLNRNTPFRGEHWAMLYAWVDAGTWFSKLSKVVNIEYFGDHRFQPLNSAPMILGYLAFGTHFFPYLLVSIFFQGVLALGVVRLLDILRDPQSKTPWRDLLRKYPLEFSLFMVLFPGMEVLFWTYYHYIQIGTTLTVFAVGYYLRAEGLSDRVKAYVAVTLASLFYEPFLLVLLIFLVVNGLAYVNSKSRFFLCDLAVPAAVFFAIGIQYLSGDVSKAVTLPPDVSVLNGILLQAGHAEIFRAMGAYNKILFVLYNQVLLLIHLAMSSLVPAFAHKTNLYEMMPVAPQVESLLPLFLCIAVGAYFILFNKLKRSHHLLLAVFGLCTASIIWGRPGSGHYPSTQFRYGYMVLPFLFVLSLDLVSRIPIKRKYISYGLLYLFVVNSASSLVHGERLEKSFETYSRFIAEKKNKGTRSDEIVKETAAAILDYKIPAPGYEAFLIYNGRGAMAKFYKQKG